MLVHMRIFSMCLKIGMARCCLKKTWSRLNTTKRTLCKGYSTQLAGSVFNVTIFLPNINRCNRSLHERPWISPWIKSISNELNITFHVLASQLSGHCDVISHRLWRLQQNVNRASTTLGQCVNIVVFIVIYRFVISCKKWNNACTLLTNCLCAHLSAILVFFPSLLCNSGHKHQNNLLVSA